MIDSKIKAYFDEYFSIYPDNHSLKSVAEFFIKFPGNNSNLEFITGDILRISLDEVIAMPRTNRFSLDELEKTEKKYIGTKVEILFRDTFELIKGNKLYLIVDGQEVDVKNTIGSI